MGIREAIHTQNSSNEREVEVTTKMNRGVGVAAAAVLATGALLSLTACGTNSTAQSAPTTSTSQQAANAVVLDVRTPAEYSSGHLEGAQNVDFSSSNFRNSVSTLPKSGSYIVYCRSGNRSAAATGVMKELGFTNVTDAGGMEAAAQETGLPVVTG